MNILFLKLNFNNFKKNKYFINKNIENKKNINNINIK